MISMSSEMVDPVIFTHLQLKIDEDVKVREEIRFKLQDLERQGERHLILLS